MKGSGNQGAGAGRKVAAIAALAALLLAAVALLRRRSQQQGTALVRTPHAGAVVAATLNTAATRNSAGIGAPSTALGAGDRSAPSPVAPASQQAPPVATPDPSTGAPAGRAAAQATAIASRDIVAGARNDAHEEAAPPGASKEDEGQSTVPVAAAADDWVSSRADDQQGRREIY